VAGQLVTLIVAPHPDDETIGTGIWMHRHRDTRIILLHITDGSPRDLSNAKAAGFERRESYSAARRRELVAAVTYAGLTEQQLRSFAYIDQESHLHVREIIDRLIGVIDELRPDQVFSPAYEGGHPDHDTAAFAVTVARQQCTRSFRHREYRLYHGRLESETDATMDTRDFLPCPTIAIEQQVLSMEEQGRKQQMFAAFESQQEVLQAFHLPDERFRDAPSYNFREAPHQGPLLYERWGWALSGAEWRECIASAV
jgi:N-acetylglucosamine malate deacetylase 2